MAPAAAGVDMMNFCTDDDDAAAADDDDDGAGVVGFDGGGGCACNIRPATLFLLLLPLVERSVNGVFAAVATAATATAAASPFAVHQDGAICGPSRWSPSPSRPPPLLFSSSP